MKFHTKILVFSLLCSASTMSMSAQHTIKGHLLTATDRVAIADGYVVLLQEGKIIDAVQTDKAGAFKFVNKKDGSYQLNFSGLGYASLVDSLHIVGSVDTVYCLKRLEVNLSEATITADASESIKRMANGQRFVLSAKAKKLRNPYQALKEIPLLISDPNTSSVKLQNGSVPLVLIDGNMVNSGISPILPEDIESVEVINSVSARYLQDGISSIVNIRLKKRTHPYLWLEAATRHEVPIHKGFGVGYFEVGNQKYSLYGRVAYDYTHDSETESSVNRNNTGYTQNFERKACNNMDSWLGELLFKYCATPKDYLAFQFYGTMADIKDNQMGNGLFQPNANKLAQRYLLSAQGKEDSKIATTSLYYKHSFDDSKTLETRLAYNYNKNNYDALRTDAYDDQIFTTPSVFDNERQSVNLNIDYAQTLKNNQEFIVGSSSLMQYNEVNNVQQLQTTQSTRFKHDYFNQYFYVGYSANLKDKVYYGASVGIEGIWQKSAGRKSHYFRPKANANATWLITPHHSLQLSYTLTNTAPSVANLNPYNISTDSLVIEVGNPNLKPQMMHYVGLNYTFNAGKFYLMPNAYYKRINDMIEACGYTHEGIYYNTYANSGHFSQTAAGIDLSYRFKWGQVYGGGGWYANYYENQHAKHMAYASCGFDASIKNFSFFGNLSYNSRSYTKIAYTQYYRPSTATLQVNYNFTPDFYIGICLQHFTGENRVKTVTNDGSFRSIVETRYKEQNLRPFFILRYTFRKNPKSKIRLGKVLDSKEQGITIKR